MAFDPGLVERVADVLASSGESLVRQKNVFGGRGFLVGKSTFAIVFGESLLVKTRPADYPAALATPGVAPFAPGGDRPMGTWVVVDGEVVADDPELAEWVRRGLAAIR